MLRQKRHVRRLAIIPAIVPFVLVLAIPGRAQDGSPLPRPDCDGTLRQEEDWFVLGRPGAMRSTDLFDPIKYVPLTKDESIWASFGGGYSLRLEGWSNFTFDESNDAVFLLSRLRLHTDMDRLQWDGGRGGSAHLRCSSLRKHRADRVRLRPRRRVPDGRGRPR